MSTTLHHLPDATGSSAVDRRADQIADLLCAGTLSRAAWTHEAHVLAAVALVRRHGAAGALDVLARAIPTYNELTGTSNTVTSGYHHTLTVFYVWAVDRLLAAGLSTTGVLWHPLTDRHTPACWWDHDTLWSPAARRGWVEPTLAQPGDPRPAQPQGMVAA